jgi:hypothetical protein
MAVGMTGLAAIALILGWQAMAEVQDGPIQSQPAAPAPRPDLADRPRIQEAQINYRALREGRKHIGDLTQQELADVDALDRYLRGQKPDTRSLSQRCVDDETRRAGGSVSQLEARVIAMRCREAGD